jgi:hypothetical protein
MASMRSAPLSAAIRRTASSEARRLRLAITTWRPALASDLAHSNPIPELPPVTMTLPSLMPAPS